MKYALVFAATAAANEAYGGYGADAKSSAVVKSISSVKPIGYTTVIPGHGKQPVTVTTQHQPYPTCVSAAYGANSCDKWDEATYLSTIIKDYNNNYATVTKIEQPITVYHTKTTITHSATGSSTPTGGFAAPTGTAYKNGTEGCWYELYEKIEEVPYSKLGPHALPGYPGSGLYKEGEKKQPVHVKEYKGGKWSEYDHEYSYGTPQPEVSTFEKPGVYTVPSKDVTVKHPVTYPAEATKTAKAGETCTYGGQYIEAKQTGYITGGYAAYETKVNGGKTVTETVVKHTTLYASTTGRYEVTKPTTTVYDHDTEIAYPTAKHYEAGVYHHEAQTVTVTKGGQAYTCEYEQTKKYEATSTPTEGHATSTLVHDNGYGHSKPSATPKKPTEGEDVYPTFSGNNKPSSSIYSTPSYNGGQGYGGEAKSTPVAASSKSYEAVKSAPVYGGEAKSTPVAALSKSYEAVKSAPVYGSSQLSSSTSCTDELKHSTTPVKSSAYTSVVYGHPTSSAVKASVYETKEYAHPSSTPIYGSENSVKSSSTSCTESEKSSATPIKSSADSTGVQGYASSTSAKPSAYETTEYAGPSSTPVYGQSSSSMATSSSCTDSESPSATLASSSVYETKEYAQSSSTPVYEAKSSSAMSTSTSCTSSLTPSATPAKSSVYNVEIRSTMVTSTSCTDSYITSATPVASSVAYTPIAATSTSCSTDLYGNATPSPVAPGPSSDYEEPAANYGKTEPGYTKRGGVIRRRMVVSAKAKRTILL